MILAAGGVVLRDGRGHDEVLVVHRVRRDDWSLPKGKLDPGESFEAAALREVEEETGVRAAILRPLTTTRYTVDGEPKEVHWFEMAPTGGDPRERAPDGEVDVAAWWPIEQAVRQLTYPHDRALLHDHAASGRG